MGKPWGTVSVAGYRSAAQEAVARPGSGTTEATSYYRCSPVADFSSTSSIYVAYSPVLPRAFTDAPNWNAIEAPRTARAILRHCATYLDLPFVQPASPLGCLVVRIIHRSEEGAGALATAARANRPVRRRTYPRGVKSRMLRTPSERGVTPHGLRQI